MGAAFLYAYVGIQGELRRESYINSWLGLLKVDNVRSSAPVIRPEASRSMYSTWISNWSKR
ncbi:dna primase [Pseudomonas fluorescens BRIP34879]|nr:dna primase [Pseudomonas fluorescens BRIP34879]